MTGEEQVALLRMALAEAGYPNASVRVDHDGDASVSLTGPNGVPDRVCWLAFKVCGLAKTCWPCWSGGYDCSSGDPSENCEGVLL